MDKKNHPIISIMAGGPSDLLPDLSFYRERTDVWIGADRGVWTLLDAGITPDYGFGDFDSITEEEWRKIQKKTEHLKIYPSEKDETDLEIALLAALEKRPREIHILGATGGRMDHFLGGLQLLQKESILPYHKETSIYISDRNNRYTVKTPGLYRVDREEGMKYVSFLSVTGKAAGICLSGFKYPLTDATLERGSTLCISNELISDSGNVSFREGILMMIRSRD